MSTHAQKSFLLFVRHFVCETKKQVIEAAAVSCYDNKRKPAGGCFIARETLAYGTAVHVNAAHKFGADAILLAHFCRVRRGEAACDLGTGCGIIPLRWHDRGHRGTCAAVDISPEAIALLRQSLAENEIDHIQALCGDLRTRLFAADTQFDVISCNPPYFTGGVISPVAARATARHETACTLPEVCACAARLLRDGGRFCVCHRPERLTDVLCALREARLEPKRMQLVAARPEKEPWLVLVEAQKYRAPGLRVLPTLVTENADGTRPSPALRAIYEKENPDA